MNLIDDELINLLVKYVNKDKYYVSDLEKIINLEAWKNLIGE